MKRFLQVALVALVSIATLHVYAGQRTDDSKHQSDQKLRELMIVRRGVLRELVKARSKEMDEIGGSRFGVCQTFFLATDELLEAELALAESRKGRVQFLRVAVENSKRVEADIARRSDASRALILQTKARRIQTQIALRDEERKQQSK